MKKLTAEDAKGIRHSYHSGGMSLKALSLVYRVSRTQIWRIVHNLQHRTSSSLRSEEGLRQSKRVNTREDKELLALLKGLNLSAD